MVSGRSAAFATLYGLPLSRASSWASSSACFSMRSASLYIRLPRCAADIFFQGPFSNAARAAATALSTSAASASATWVMTSPVEGLMVGNDFPEAASTHLLLMRSFVALTFTVGSITAVAMGGLLRNTRVGQTPRKNRSGQATKGYSCGEKEAMKLGRNEEEQRLLTDSG